MASVLYDLRMVCWLFVWQKSEAVRSGVGVVENLEPGVIPAEGKSYLFSPDRGQNMVAVQRKHVATKKKRHPTFKSDAPFWLLCKVFPDEISPRLHLHETLRVGQNRYIWQMFEAEATRHYKPQCKKSIWFHQAGTYFRFRVRVKLVTI